MRIRTQAGFALVEVGLIIVVVGIIGTLGYVALKNRTVSSNPESNRATTAITVSNSTDLANVKSELDTLDLMDDKDTSELYSQISGF